MQDNNTPEVNLFENDTLDDRVSNFIDALDYYGGNETDPCQPAILAEGSAAVIIGTMAVLMFIILTFTTKRNNKYPGCCKQRGGLLLPVNFLEDKTSRGMIVAAFLFTAIGVWDSISELDTLKETLPVFIIVLIKVLYVLAFTLCYIPLFHCISVKTLFRQLLGLIYIATSTVLAVMESTSVCPWQQLDSEHLSYQLVYYIILLSSGGYLTYKFLFRIIKIIAEYRKAQAPTVFVYPYQVQYIKNILKPPPPLKEGNEEHTLMEKLLMIIKKLSYQSIPGFRFSISILVSISVGLLVYLLLITQILGEAVDIYQYYSDLFKDNQDILNSTIPNVSLCLGVAFSAVQICYTVILMLKSYRVNILRLYRKEINEDIMNVKNLSPVSLMVSGIQFTGYQVAHMVWGYGLQAFVGFLLCFLIGELIVIPARFGYWGVLWTLINKFGPILTVILITMIIQRILVTKFFLEEHGKVFGVDNRKGFYCFMFFMFYYNVLTGMITCIFRVIKALVIGVWFFPRLDMSIFPRVGESFDTGYKAYVCLLALEQMQNNIILNTFFELLIEASQNAKQLANGLLPVISTEAVFLPITLSEAGKRARNRWFLAWTLIHNPSLSADRRRPPTSTIKTRF